jgi:hypothetical protein
MMVHTDVFGAFADIRPPLPMGEQLYWTPQLPLLFYVLDFFEHTHH